MVIGGIVGEFGCRDLGSKSVIAIGRFMWSFMFMGLS